MNGNAKPSSTVSSGVSRTRRRRGRAVRRSSRATPADRRVHRRRAAGRTRVPAADAAQEREPPRRRRHAAHRKWKARAKMRPSARFAPEQTVHGCVCESLRDGLRRRDRRRRAHGDDGLDRGGRGAPAAAEHDVGGAAAHDARGVRFDTFRPASSGCARAVPAAGATPRSSWRRARASRSATSCSTHVERATVPSPPPLISLMDDQVLKLNHTPRRRRRRAGRGRAPLGARRRRAEADALAGAYRLCVPLARAPGAGFLERVAAASAAGAMRLLAVAVDEALRLRVGPRLPARHAWLAEIKQRLPRVPVLAHGDRRACAAQSRARGSRPPPRAHACARLRRGRPTPGRRRAAAAAAAGRFEHVSSFDRENLAICQRRARRRRARGRRAAARAAARARRRRVLRDDRARREVHAALAQRLGDGRRAPRAPRLAARRGEQRTARSWSASSRSRDGRVRHGHRQPDIRHIASRPRRSRSTTSIGRAGRDGCPRHASRCRRRRLPSTGPSSTRAWRAGARRHVRRPTRAPLRGRRRAAAAPRCSGSSAAPVVAGGRCGTCDNRAKARGRRQREPRRTGATARARSRRSPPPATASAPR